ncbi:MAG TPA: hypothetical protein VFU29_02790 [Chitinophagaceae bacterium]|nr:hypothetical protein [Chitinophagaceae bacterium]
MKKIVIYFLMLALPATTFCQKTNDSVPSVQNDYLQRSKNQKTVAWVLLGGGTALIATGIIVGSGKESTFSDAAGGAAVAGIGLLSTISSIPLFIASGKNKRKATKASAFIKMETAPLLQKQSFVQHSYPVFSVNIRL